MLAVLGAEDCVVRPLEEIEADATASTPCVHVHVEGAPEAEDREAFFLVGEPPTARDYLETANEHHDFVVWGLLDAEEGACDMEEADARFFSRARADVLELVEEVRAHERKADRESDLMAECTRLRDEVARLEARAARHEKAFHDEHARHVKTLDQGAARLHLLELAREVLEGVGRCTDEYTVNHCKVDLPGGIARDYLQPVAAAVLDEVVAELNCEKRPGNAAARVRAALVKT